MDAVITYVDGNDPVWREAYRSRLGDGINGKHFRDWGTLKYLLRGIEGVPGGVRRDPGAGMGGQGESQDSDASRHHTRRVSTGIQLDRHRDVPAPHSGSRRGVHLPQ